MKNLITILLSSIATLGFAQNPKYTQAMQKTKSLLDTATVVTTYQQATNSFERISTVEKGEWLPLYYEAYTLSMQGVLNKDKDKKDEFYDKGMALIDKADSLNPNNSEIYSMRAFIYQMQLSVNPMIRAQKLGPKANQVLDKAMELDSTNPRPYFLKGSGLFYTPAMFGGGKDKAKILFEQALEKYKVFKPKNDLYPSWGEKQTKQMLEQCNK